MTTISVVIPTYNCQAYLAEAVQSALSQCADGISIEVIVIDDGSTDDTSQVMAAIAHPSLRYIQQANQGVSAARNRGIMLSQSDLVAFLDADDYFFPHKLAQQAALFQAEAALGLVQSGWQQVNEVGKAMADIRPWEWVPQLTLEKFLKFKPILPSALMVKREWLLQVGGFDPSLQAAEDVDLVSRLALKGCRAAWLTEVAVSYRQRANSAMGNGLVQARDLNKFLDKFFQQPDLPDSVRLLERSVRYYTLVWSAWYLYDTGHLPEMVQELQHAWHYTPYLPIEALIHWIESFSSFSEDRQRPIDISALMHSQDWQQLVKWLLAQ